jgi:putative membrane-bound dehydrogenase-like protein
MIHRMLYPLFLAGSAALAGTEQIGPHLFTVANGFGIRLAAGTNLVNRPVSGCFDDRGRLYVTDASGSTAAPEEQLKDPRWRVLRLEDTDGDGIFDRSIVFADKLPFLQGILWYKGEVYVGGTPNIVKLLDTDGDGIADRRVEWWNVGRPPTHCGNEVHGPYAGPDGYIYWTKGAFQPITWTNGVTGKIEHDRCAHIFRAKPDGSGMESVMTGGMDNPVEVAFNAVGECFFTTTFVDFTRPGNRDGLCHAVYGGVFGKVNDVLDDHAVQRTVDLMQPIAQFGAAAPSGLCRYDRQAFGPAYEDNLFASLFNLHKITRHVLRPSGGTYASETTDFVSSDNLDFHPTDVITAPDGSLVILDTGGWYKLCCPSSQLAKADVLGSVYTVRRTAKPDPAPSAPGIPKDIAELQYQWKRAAMRRVSMAKPSDLAGLLAKPSRSEAEDGLMRVAAEGLGRAREAGATPALLDLAAQARDLSTECSAIRALIEIGDASALRRAMSTGDAKQKRAALIALDQLDSDPLRADEASPLLLAKEDSVRQAAGWIVTRHADWGDSLAGFFREQLRSTNLAPASRAALHSLLENLTDSADIQRLLGEIVGDAAFPVETQAAALDAMASASLKNPPAAWREGSVQALKRSLDSLDASSSRLQLAAIHATQKMAASSKKDPSPAIGLLECARSDKPSRAARILAYEALPAGWTPEPKDTEFLASAVRQGADGIKAAEAFSHAVVPDNQTAVLLDLVKTAGPLELPSLLNAFDRGGDEASGLQLLQTLRDARARSSIRPGALRAHLAKYPETVKAAGEKWIADYYADAPQQQSHLEAVAKSLPPGDIRRGQQVFNSSKTQCIVCHKLGYQGGDVGPDLTSIGQARSDRDLLESIVYPSASFVRSYEPVVAVTKSGDTYNGILRRDDDRGILLLTGPGTQQEIARGDVASVRPGDVSVMPSGFEEMLNRQDLADIIAFLKNTRWGPN